MRVKTFTGTAWVSSCLAVLLQTHAFAANLMEEGKQYYSQSNFGKAEKSFEAEIKANPKNADAHYMLGNVYVELDREKEAVQEYNQSLHLDPHGVTSLYCQKALTAITLKHTPAPPGFCGRFPLPPNTVPPPGPPEKSQTSQSQAIPESPATTPTQTSEADDRMSEECEARIRDVNRDAERQIADLQREQQERIDANKPAMAVRMAYRVFQSADDKATKEEISRKIEAIKAQQAKKIAELKLTYKAKQGSGSSSGSSTYVRSYETTNKPSSNGVPKQP